MIDMERKTRDAREAADKIVAFTDLDAMLLDMSPLDRTFLPADPPDYLSHLSDRVDASFFRNQVRKGHTMHELSGMNVTVKVETLLETLKTNRETHKQIVVEARAGYMKKAESALRARLDKIKSGKIDALVFGLSLPVDQTKVYDTAIRLLEVHTQDEMELTPTQVRNLVMDEWDWTDHFAMTNSAYSDTAAERYGSPDE